MRSKKGERSTYSAILFIRFFLTALLFFAMAGGPVAPAAAEDWKNLVQPTGSPYTGLLWQMEAEGAQGPLLTPTEANSLLAQYRGCVYPPFDAYVPISEQTSVTLIKTTKTLYFSRTFNTSDPDPDKRSYPAGSWVMRAATVRGLTAEQIRDVFALPAVPRGISYARVPAGHVLWTGIAGPINQSVNPAYPDWGRGGGEQIFIDRRFSTSERGEVEFVSKELTGRALLYAPMAGSGNAQSVASYFDSLIPSPGTPQGTIDPALYNSRNLDGAYSKLDEVLGPLDWLSFGDQAPFVAALDQVGPERYGALARVQVRNNLLFGKAFNRRGLSGADGFGMDMTGSNAAAGAARRADADGPRNDGRNTFIWAAGLGEFGTQDGFGDRTGFDFSSGGFVIGADIFRKEGLVLGVGAGYLRTGLDWANEGGSADIDSAKIGIYSNYTGTAGWFVDALLAGGYDSVCVKRNIVFLDFASTASSEPDGYDSIAQVRFGRDFPVGGWTFSPVAELSYVYIHQNEFDESGADPLNLGVRSMDDQTFRTQLGVRAKKDFAVSGGSRVTPSIEVAWAHEIPLDNRTIESGIIGQSGTFLVSGIDRETDSLVIDAGLEARLRGNLTVRTGYGAEISDKFISHQVGLGLKYGF